MAAILDLVNFHRFKGLEKNAIPFFLITVMFQMGINKKSLLTNILHENTLGHILHVVPTIDVYIVYVDSIIAVLLCKAQKQYLLTFEVT